MAADAMEGPDACVGVIHATTMVTAGVFTVCAVAGAEYAPFTLDFITIVGALTAIFAATIALPV